MTYKRTYMGGLGLVAGSPVTVLRGSKVAELQARLVAAGRLPRGGADGIGGGATITALEVIAAEQGLPTGMVTGTNGNLELPSGLRTFVMTELQPETVIDTVKRLVTGTPKSTTGTAVNSKLPSTAGSSKGGNITPDVPPGSTPAPDLAPTAPVATADAGTPSWLLPAAVVGVVLVGGAAYAMTRKKRIGGTVANRRRRSSRRRAA